MLSLVTRAVVDGKPVTDIEMSQGIPGEVTDHTDNLKAATDKTPQTHTITYQAEPQKATIAYQDMTTGKTIKTDTINGISDTMMTYDTASNIASYVKQGYVVKYNNFTDGAENLITYQVLTKVISSNLFMIQKIQ